MSLSMWLRSEDRNTWPTLLNSEPASPSKALLLRDLEGDARTSCSFFFLS